ncbi:hypothetical protein J6590_049570 [Homalodisca vitripennis]|nr:hypothetical protein J6590_049570 [Homalodisca vitripennis]
MVEVQGVVQGKGLTNPNGRSFDIQTGDRQVVTVNLRQPLDDMVEGLVETNPNGRSFDIQTGDRQVVTVNLRQPLDDMVEGLVEVQGVVQGKGLVMCDYYINFPPELAETFDLELDNETAVLLNAIPNPWR